MRKSPETVQHWIDTIPPAHIPSTSTNCNPPTPNVYIPQPAKQLQNKRSWLRKDLSQQSDDASSHCSSVESVLDMRKPDPETVLIELGFGPPKTEVVSRIPSRFLQPSKLLTEFDIEKFLEQYGESRYPEPSSAPPSPARSQQKNF